MSVVNQIMHKNADGSVVTADIGERYTLSSKLEGGSYNVIRLKDSQGESAGAVAIIPGDGISFSTVGNSVTLNHATYSGYNHIPAGGSNGQVLKWSSEGTAQWGTNRKTAWSGSALVWNMSTINILEDTDARAIEIYYKNGKRAYILSIPKPAANSTAEICLVDHYGTSDADVGIGINTYNATSANVVISRGGGAGNYFVFCQAPQQTLFSVEDTTYVGAMKRHVNTGIAITQIDYLY